jgi:casein kinase 1
VFDWTILKYQQSQIASAPPRAVGHGAGPSGLAPPALQNDRQSGNYLEKIPRSSFSLASDSG